MAFKVSFTCKSFLADWTFKRAVTGMNPHVGFIIYRILRYYTTNLTLSHTCWSHKFLFLANRLHSIIKLQKQKIKEQPLVLIPTFETIQVQMWICVVGKWRKGRLHGHVSLEAWWVWKTISQHKVATNVNETVVCLQIQSHRPTS
jgi:hypothetical protein